MAISFRRGIQKMKKISQNKYIKGLVLKSDFIILLFIKGAP